MSIWTSQSLVGLTHWYTSESLLTDKKRYMSWLSLCMTVDLVIDVLQRDYVIWTSKQLEEVSLRIITYLKLYRDTKSDRYVLEKNVIESMSINGVKCIWHLKAGSYEQGYKNRASEVAYLIDFIFAFFAMFKTSVLLILRISIGRL